MNIKSRGHLTIRYLTIITLILLGSSIVPEVISDARFPIHTFAENVSVDGLSTQQPTNEIRQFQIPTNNSGPNAIISAPNGVFWFVEFTGGKLGEFFAQNNSFKEYLIPENKSVPASLGKDHLGNIWFSDQSGNGSIWMFNPATDHFTQFNTLTRNSNPLFILADNQNDIWFTESTANRIGELVYPNYKMVDTLCRRQTLVQSRWRGD